MAALSSMAWPPQSHLRCALLMQLAAWCQHIPTAQSHDSLSVRPERSRGTVRAKPRTKCIKNLGFARDERVKAKGCWYYPGQNASMPRQPARAACLAAQQPDLRENRPALRQEPIALRHGHRAHRPSPAMLQHCPVPVRPHQAACPPHRQIGHAASGRQQSRSSDCRDAGRRTKIAAPQSSPGRQLRLWRLDQVAEAAPTARQK